MSFPHESEGNLSIQRPKIERKLALYNAFVASLTIMQKGSPKNQHRPSRQENETFHLLQQAEIEKFRALKLTTQKFIQNKRLVHCSSDKSPAVIPESNTEDSVNTVRCHKPHKLVNGLSEYQIGSLININVSKNKPFAGLKGRCDSREIIMTTSRQFRRFNQAAALSREKNTDSTNTISHHPIFKTVPKGVVGKRPRQRNFCDFNMESQATLKNEYEAKYIRKVLKKLPKGGSEYSCFELFFTKEPTETFSDFTAESSSEPRIKMRKRPKSKTESQKKRVDFNNSSGSKAKMQKMESGLRLSKFFVRKNEWIKMIEKLLAAKDISDV